MRRLTLAILGLCLLAAPARAQEQRLGDLRAAARSSPSDADASLALGRALRRAGHFAEALTELRRGLSLAGGRSGPGATSLRYEVARVYMDDHRFRDALGACQPLGKTALAHACAAEAHMVRRRATEALPEAELALQQDPQLYEARVVQAEAQWLEGSMDEAETGLRAAIAAEPKRIEARLLLGDLYVAQGKRGPALESLQAARSADPDDPDAAFAVGSALGPTNDGAAALEAAVAGRPSFGAAWARLADARLAQGRTAEAEKAAQTALKLDPKQADWHASLARVYEKQKRYAEALTEAHASLKILPNSASAKLVEADVYAAQGDIDMALEAYQASFGLARSDPTPLVHAANACLASSRETSAKAFAERSTQMFPEFGPGWVALGDVLVKGNERAAARRAYETALSRESVDAAEVRRKLGALR
jgi:tetratricopeptide (TPR) repeat protein